MIRSFTGTLWTTQHGPTLLEKSSVAPISKTALQSASFSQVSTVGRSLLSLTPKRRGLNLQLTKASETASVLASEVSSNKSDRGPSEKKNNHKSTFPKGLEALVLEVCDETEIVELKLKVGDFELHMKRDIGTPKSTVAPPIVSPTIAPPIPSKPMVDSNPTAQPTEPSKSSPTSTNPFANVATTKASKLAALEASGLNGYILVSSTTVGSFRKGRTLKGKKQPPSCQEGAVIKEGHTIGYLDQFGNELPVKSDVAGKVVKVLFEDGEAVGYGDPLIAVLP